MKHTYDEHMVCTGCSGAYAEVRGTACASPLSRVLRAQRVRRMTAEGKAIQQAGIARWREKHREAVARAIAGMVR